MKNMNANQYALYILKLILDQLKTHNLLTRYDGYGDWSEMNIEFRTDRGKYAGSWVHLSFNREKFEEVLDLLNKNLSDIQTINFDDGRKK